LQNTLDDHSKFVKNLREKHDLELQKLTAEMRD
jgi:hypothetical protein